MKNSASEEDYFRRLSKNGIGVKKKNSPKYGEHYVYELLDFSKVPEGTKLPKHGNRSARSYKLGTLYGPEALQVEIERFNRIMKKIEEEGTFTLDISIDVPTTSVKVEKNFEKETVQPTSVTAPEISYEALPSSVEIEAEEQEIEYVPKHKKSASDEEIVIPAPVTQGEIQRAGVQLEQQVVVPPPIVDDEEDDDDEIVKEVEKYAKRENVQENFLTKAKRKIKEKVESRQRNLSNRFRNLPFSDVSGDLDKEKDDRELGG